MLKLFVPSERSAQTMRLLFAAGYDQVFVAKMLHEDMCAVLAQQAIYRARRV